jgi:hypothetical protein
VMMVRRSQHKESAMHVEIKSWLLLCLTLVFFALLCAVAAASAIMQPARWSERRASFRA